MKKYGILAGLTAMVFVGLLILAPQLKARYERAHLQPEVVFSASLEHMGTLNSFCYEIHSSFQVEGRQEIVSDISGQRQQGKVHIQGNMVQTPVDIYCIGGRIYHYDAQAEKWMVVETETRNAAELYIHELNPLVYLDFRENGMKSDYTFGELDGEECLIVRGKPQMRHELLASVWQDFSAVLWIDYKQNLVRQIQLTAVNRNNAQTQLEIRSKFSQFDGNLDIEPPDLTKKKISQEES